VDLDLGLIRGLETTTASVHDSRVDLSLLGEVAYLDKAYSGVELGVSAASLFMCLWLWLCCQPIKWTVTSSLRVYVVKWLR